MHYTNYQEVLSTLQSYDFSVNSLDVTGKIVRCKRDGRSQKGWYVLHSIRLDGGGDALIGSFGFFEGAGLFKEKISPGKGIKLSKDQCDALAKQHKENAIKAQAERKREIEKASARATNEWARYVVDGESDYLKRKGVGAYGVRYSPSGNGTTAIPMMQTTGQIMALQIIRGKNRPKGKMEKEYWPKGMGKQGAFHLIGGSPQKVLLVTEGYATGATLHEATNLPVAIAFDAGNLLPVAEALHKKYPLANILICADDDYLVRCHAKVDGKACNHYNLAGEIACEQCGNQLHHQGRSGEDKAQAASIAVSGAYVLPEFPFDRERKKLTDFNDLANAPNCSLSTVRVQIEEKIQSLGWAVGDVNHQRADSRARGVGEFEYQPAVSVMGIDELVERFIPIDDGIGETVFDTRTFKLVQKKQMLALMEAGTKLDDIKRHYLWITRGSYYLEEVGFDPSRTDNDVKLNLFTGFEIRQTPDIDIDDAGAGCDKLMSILLHLVSGEKNSEELLDWLIKWMAYPLQHPGAKMASAVILHGPQGTGKSLIFKTLAKIYGRYSTVIGNRGIEDKFNADWSDSKLFILAEEIATSQDKWNIKNELKELVTGETVRVRGMHTTAYHQRNCMNLAFLSNESLPLPIENDDRRHCVIYTPPKLKKQNYIDAIEQLDDGGVQAFYDYLMLVDLDGFTRHTQPPMSAAKDDLIRMSMSSHERFIDEWLSGDLSVPVMPCTTADLYSLYQHWCKQSGERNPRANHLFLGELKKKQGWQSFRERLYLDETCTGERRQKTVICPPQECLDDAYSQDADTLKAHYLTRMCIEFNRLAFGNDEAALYGT